MADFDSNPAPTSPGDAHSDGTHDPILDSINEGVFTVDHQWRITAFNRAAERITGVRRQDALGRQCSDVFRANICEGACALRRRNAFPGKMKQ